MKLFLTNREQLQSLGSSLVSEFDSLITKIRESWNIEHDSEGRHGHVHATSVASGRITFSGIVQDTILASQLDNYQPAGLDTAALLRLDSTQTSVVSITGIKVPQDESGTVLDGRVLVLENVSTVTTFVLGSESTYSVPRNRFRTASQADPLDESAPTQVYLAPVSLLLLTYNATLARWIIHSENLTANVRLLEQATGTYNNLTIANWLSLRTLRLSFTGALASITGFDSTGVPETHRKTLVNAGLYAVDILHSNTGSLVDNRVACPGGVRYRLHPRESCEILRTVEGWRIVEKADQWADVTFNALNFTASSGDWTLASGDQTTLTYQLDGNKMTVSFELDTTTVSATPTELRIAIPLGRIAARKMSAPLSSAVDNGTALDTGRAEVVAGGTYISIYKNASNTAWAAAANTTAARGQFTFMIRDDSATISETHTDVSHGDTSHADAEHSDVAHVDVAAVSTHTDSAHSDASHADTIHVDTAHVDTAHSDVAHADSTPTHGDTVHGDHTDLGAAQEHVDNVHEDTPHTDVAFSDVAHVDTAHVDTAHSDSSHADTAHGDAHSDSPHTDTAHSDAGHGDTAHADSVHQDVGYHTDTTHVDI